MNTTHDSNRFAPPTAREEGVGMPAMSGELAGQWSRLGAALIDGILWAGIVLWIVSPLMPSHPLRPRPSPADGLMVVTIEYTLAGFVVLLVLHGYLLQTRGQTIGKMLLRIRIVRTDGARATLARLAGLRYFANNVLALIPIVGWFYWLLDAVMIFRPSRKCLHDNIADTIVVKA